MFYIPIKTKSSIPLANPEILNHYKFLVLSLVFDYSQHIQPFRNIYKTDLSAINISSQMFLGILRLLCLYNIRNISSPDIPFVTVEYSLEKHKILQCYGYHDTKPDTKVLNYVNKIWLPYANRKVRKIQKAA